MCIYTQLKDKHLWAAVSHLMPKLNSAWFPQEDMEQLLERGMEREDETQGSYD